jgi:hypothetical protein
MRKTNVLYATRRSYFKTQRTARIRCHFSSNNQLKSGQQKDSSPITTNSCGRLLHRRVELSGIIANSYTVTATTVIDCEHIFRLPSKTRAQRMSSLHIRLPAQRETTISSKKRKRHAVYDRFLNLIIIRNFWSRFVHLMIFGSRTVARGVCVHASRHVVSKGLSE